MFVRSARLAEQNIKDSPSTWWSTLIYDPILAKTHAHSPHIIKKCIPLLFHLPARFWLLLLLLLLQQPVTVTSVVIHLFLLCLFLHFIHFIWKFRHWFRTTMHSTHHAMLDFLPLSMATCSVCLCVCVWFDEFSVVQSDGLTFKCVPKADIFTFISHLHVNPMKISNWVLQIDIEYQLITLAHGIGWKFGNTFPNAATDEGQRWTVKQS